MFEIGDRVIDDIYKGTVLGTVTPGKTIILYDDGVEFNVPNRFLKKLIPTPTKLHSLTYWK